MPSAYVHPMIRHNSLVFRGTREIRTTVRYFSMPTVIREIENSKYR